MEHLLVFIENHGVGLVIICILIYFMVKKGNKWLDKQPCIIHKDFITLKEDVKSVKKDVNDLKNMLTGFLFSFKFRGKEDE